MPERKYPYATIPIPPSPPYPGGQTVARPLALATLTASSGESLRCLVLLDTGADACLFPLAMAIALKIDVLALPSTLTGGVGTSANVTYYDTITIDLASGVAFTALVGFTEGMNAHGMGLLGQDGFFSSFDVHFSRRSKVFTIQLP